jgi:hypothetical protein
MISSCVREPGPSERGRLFNGHLHQLRHSRKGDRNCLKDRNNSTLDRILTRAAISDFANLLLGNMLKRNWRPQVDVNRTAREFAEALCAF